MLSQVLVTVVGLVDIAMVGRVGPKAQAAVGYASQFFALAQFGDQVFAQFGFYRQHLIAACLQFSNGCGSIGQLRDLLKS